MRKYALVDNNTVVSVLDLEEAEYIEKASKHSLVIDIQDQSPLPEVGWVLEGNRLVAHTESMSAEQLDAYQQKAQRIFGLYLLPIAVDKIGARNLKLQREATPADVNALASQMASIKLLLEGGALKTARTVCTLIKPAFPLHSDILDEVISEITAFLVKNNWN